ncbi:MAG: Na+/H+ antiporter subunit E [Gemmatimonadaceae bacterium]|nr:Na+/H+ antiporter subunit E [Gemmatimonadaceae bacterium]MCW5825548.1 Na+/H+ antiporter subunit E [Gemmatimonadaceae bacterium]
MTLGQRLYANALYAAALLAVWYILSGKADLVHLGTGALAVIAIAATIVPVEDGTRIRWLRVMLFLPWLLKEVIASNLHVARVVLTWRSRVSPRLLQLDPPLRSPRARAVLGIAATLTPGSLTVDVDEQTMQVHALDDVSAQDATDGEMMRRVAELFEESAP